MKKNILSVDGMSITKIELSSLLKDYDINIIGVTNEFDALNVLHDAKFEINAIVWTINFVDELDFSAIRGIKKRGKYKHIPVIVISRFTDKSHVIRAIESGAAEYIIKPCNEEVLLNKALKVLGLPYKRDIDKKDDAEVSLYSFSEMYNKEFKAASRGGYALSILLASVIQKQDNTLVLENEQDFTDLVKKVINTRIRETDESFKFGNNIIVLLPFADKKGTEVFREKIMEVFNNHTTLKQKKEGYIFLTSSVSFPEDGRTKEILVEKLEKSFNNCMKLNNLDNRIFLKELL